MSLLAALGIAKLGRVIALTVFVASTAGAGGFWAGTEWNKGRVAITEVSELRADAVELRDAANDLRTRSVAAAQDFRTSATRMDVIAAAHQETMDELDALYLGQQAAFERQLASVEAADLLRCRIGGFGLRVWAEAAAGSEPLDAEGAARFGAFWPEAIVPVDPAHAPGRFWPGGAADVAGSSADVPPLPAVEGPSDGGDD